MVGHVGSPFDLSQILPVGGGLLVLCSLPEHPDIEGCHGAWPGWAVLASGFP